MCQQNLKITHYRTLRTCKVPAQLALKCAAILVNDESGTRTQQEQQLINQSHQYILKHLGHQ